MMQCVINVVCAVDRDFSVGGIPMATKVKSAKEDVEGERNPLLDAVRKVLLASVGAVALAQDELEDFVNKLVDRGEIAEKDGRSLVRDMVEKRKKQTAKAEQELDQRIEELLHRMNVPSKGDIEALSAKVTELSAKVDELKKS
jgi:poly(hydroxyalkanoate) granule-associated protein